MEVKELDLELNDEELEKVVGGKQFKGDIVVPSYVINAGIYQAGRYYLDAKRIVHSQHGDNLTAACYYITERNGDDVYLYKIRVDLFEDHWTPCRPSEVFHVDISVIRNALPNRLADVAAV